MADLNCYLSHQDKTLLSHTYGVRDKIKEIRPLSISDISAIFHDIGKLNTNFQKKINPRFIDNHDSNGYSNHAYLSAYSFLCFCAANSKFIFNNFNNETEWLGSILAIIAHHHGDLPDFQKILKDSEYMRLSYFLREDHAIPVDDFIRIFIETNRSEEHTSELQSH